MTLNLPVTSTEALVFEPARQVLRLWPAVGGAQIELAVSLRRASEHKDAAPYQISAAMFIAKNPSQQRYLLARLAPSDVVNPGPVATEFRVAGFVSIEQLRVVEALRSGTDAVWVVLHISATCVAGDPAALAGRSGELAFPIHHGEWLRELERVDAGSYVEILVPLTSNTEYANAVRRLRNARALIQDDRPEEALVEMRKALEAVRDGEGTLRIVQQAQSKKPRERNQSERWAFLVEDIFSLLSGAAHDDADTTEHFEWTRADATALLSTTAGLLNRLAHRDKSYGVIPL